MANALTVRELCDIFVKIVNTYNKMDNMPYYFSPRLKLHLSEVHTVNAIGRNPNINVTNLAKLQGVTKGAVSQMVRKLVRKGVVLKKTSPETENEVVLTLTETGVKVFQWHEKYHGDMDKKIFDFLEKMPEESLESIKNFSFETLDIFEKLIESKKTAMEENQD